MTRRVIYLSALLSLSVLPLACAEDEQRPIDSDDVVRERQLEQRDKRLAQLERRLASLREEEAAGAPPGEPPAGVIREFETLAARLSGEVGATLGPPGAGEAIALGPLRSGEAWSTIKVPIAMRVLERAGGPDGLTEAERRAIARAVTGSDNNAAKLLFESLDSTGAAAAAVTEVLHEAGDSSTQVSTVGRAGFSPYGQTSWPLTSQHRFMAALAGGCFAAAGLWAFRPAVGKAQPGHTPTKGGTASLQASCKRIAMTTGEVSSESRKSLPLPGDEERAVAYRAHTSASTTVRGVRHARSVMRRLTVVAAVLAAFTIAEPAAAITNGSPDGEDHPSVGALVAARQFSDGTWLYCSGTLVSSTVFLTAAHCGDSEERVRVTFDSAYVDGDKIYSGVFRPDPLYNRSQDDPHDIAVVVFDKAIKGITPARLPMAGSLSNLPGNQQFTSVGYGAYEVTNTPGGHEYLFNDVRMAATGTLNAVNPAWLRISMNPSTGNGGTCYGDSGGPNFLGTTDVIAATTITGDAVCRSTNVVYRLDTESARTFLSRYITAP